MPLSQYDLSFDQTYLGQLDSQFLLLLLIYFVNQPHFNSVPFTLSIFSIKKICMHSYINIMLDKDEFSEIIVYNGYFE